MSSTIFTLFDQIKADAPISQAALSTPETATTPVEFFTRYQATRTIDASWLDQYSNIVTYEPFTLELEDTNIVVVDPSLDTVYIDGALYNQALKRSVDAVLIQYGNDQLNRLDVDQVSSDNTIVQLTCEHINIPTIDNKFTILRYSDGGNEYLTYCRYTMIPFDVFKSIELPYCCSIYQDGQLMIDGDPIDHISVDDTEQPQYTSWEQRKQYCSEHGMPPIILKAIKIGDKFHLRLFDQDTNNYLDWLYATVARPQYVPVCIVANNRAIETELFQYKPIELDDLNRLTEPDITFV